MAATKQFPILKPAKVGISFNYDCSTRFDDTVIPVKRECTIRRTDRQRRDRTPGSRSINISDLGTFFLLLAKISQ